MADYELNNKQIFNVSILSVAITALSIFACYVGYYALRARHESEVMQKSSYRVGDEILRAQNKSISEYGVDPETGQFQIPVAEAMKRMVSDQEKAKTDQGGDEKSDET